MKSKKLHAFIKTWALSLLVCFSLSTVYANNHLESNSYLNHLSEINKEWLNRKEACPTGNISFTSDVDRIQLHLNLVIGHLKSNIPLNLNSNQFSNRTSLLDKLQQYADNKVFPINKYHAVRQPYFVDEIGTNCAVGQMIYDSGHKDLVAKISKEHNYDYIADIHTTGLQEWANEFGFTIDELKWIQPGYAPTTEIEQVLDGTNGSVTKVVNNSYDQSLTIAGNFTELDGLPCLNIGSYKNDQLSCLGAGIDGLISDVLVLSSGIYVFGELHNGGQTYPIAKYDGANWSYIEIPTREGATSSTANVGGPGFIYEVAISHSSIPQHQEIWQYLFNDTWHKKAKVNGMIFDMIINQSGRVHAGHFNSVVVYDANELIDTTLIVKNVVISSNFTNHWYGLGTNVSDTIKVLQNVGDTMVLGGTCSYQPSENNVCISIYSNSVLEPLFLNYYYANFSINTIVFKNSNLFTFGGDFELVPFSVGTFGDNLATYSFPYGYVEPIAIFDQPVNSLAYYNGSLYIGGSFETNMGQQINHLGRIISTVGIDEPVSEINMNVYPNPFNATLNVENMENGTPFSILFLDGRIAKTGTVLNEKIDGLHSLPKGAYLLQLETGRGTVIKKIYK